ncbi:MAG TPA: glycosyltransferase family 39 protein [Pyrinomonadaceae bacterium]|nr:glycosyltransferase family 39 protein [Pyrinomonadaceae bacterium]
MIQTPLTTNTSETFPLVQSSSPTGVASFWRAWRWWLPPAVIALALVLYFVDPFIGDWDGMDYTMLSLAGYPSSMALGRNLFIFANHYLYQVANTLFHVQPDHAYLIFKYTVVAQAPLAVVTSWILARDISGSLYTATTAALLIVFSPVFVLYGGQVMTDVPSVLILTTALIIHLRGIREQKFWMVLLGAAILGLGVNLRETIGLYAPWLVIAPFFLGWKLRRKEILWVAASCAVFAVLALGWFGYWFITDPHYRWVWYGWRESMREESARHPVQLSNLRPYVMLYFISAPLVFFPNLFAPILEWRKRGLSPMLLLWAVAFFANLLLFFNYSTTVNWRYFLTGLPGIVPLGAFWLLRIAQKRLGSERRAMFACASVIIVLAVTFFIFMRPVSYEFIERRAMSKEYRHRLEQVPLDAIMISGAQTIAVHYWASIGEGRWKTIGTGGGWPGDQLFAVIQNHLNHRRRVFIDVDPRWWLPCGWQREEIVMIVELEKHFSFRHVNETIYEISYLGDPAARDDPNLSRLLPENRPEDTKKCMPTRP